MSFRNLSPQKMFGELASAHIPQCAFSSGMDWAEWKRRTLPEVLATLGDFPEHVPLNPELLAEWQHDGLTKQKWIIDVSRHISATLLLAHPVDMEKGSKYPALLCCHGHGPNGKESVMGTDPGITDPDLCYGHRMAKLGYVTYALDWIGFGERNDSNKPNHLLTNAGRDWCNLYYLHATMLGMTSLSINVTHGRAATDFVSALPQVDPARMGIMGCSGGGTMTLWLALCDERFRAVEIICYSDLWAHFGIRDINYCGMQVAPGLYKLVDLPDLQGLLAPRPLLIDIAAHDTCFKIDSAMACYRKLEGIYAAAGVPKNLELDLFAGDHGWGANRSGTFFRKHLGELQTTQA